ncbi:MAG: Flp pilus assembly protein CpaB [Acidobacteriia bacterium]|nr:Flp pilus assembly protein CpaB [Terriglobia bacterium]
MNKRFIGVLIFAFIVATCGGVITYRSLINRAPVARAATPMVQIALATRNLEVGTVLREGDVKLADWPGTAPTGASARAQDFIGRGVLTAIYSNEPIIESRLAPKGAGGGLAAMIPPGMRAFAVRVNDVVGVAGFVTPGMRVDVVINGNSPGGSGTLGTLARTLLQNIEVLSAGQDIKKDGEGKPMLSQVVTLLVTPEQAEKLSLAANQTTIQLMLRNPMDRQTAQAPGSSLYYLFNQSAPKQVVADGGDRAPRRTQAAPKPPIVAHEIETPKKAPQVVEIIMGTKKSETKFENTGEGK